MESLSEGFFVLRGKRVRKLVPQLIFIPVYWLFISAAAYRAVYQLVKAPHYWEKTEHGLYGGPVPDAARGGGGLGEN